MGVESCGRFLIGMKSSQTERDFIPEHGPYCSEVVFEWYSSMAGSVGSIQLS